ERCGSTGGQIRRRNGSRNLARRRSDARQFSRICFRLLQIAKSGQTNLPKENSTSSPRDGRIHECAADSRRKKTRRKNVSARIQYHSGTGESLDGAFR